jgi:hypothetical protein
MLITLDCINATILLLKLESKRYAKQQVAAWSHDGYFTPRGQQFLSSLVGSNTNVYRVSIEDDIDFHVGTVKMSINNKSPERIVKIAKDRINN